MDKATEIAKNICKRDFTWLEDTNPTETIADLIRPHLAPEWKPYKEIAEEFTVIECFGTPTVKKAAEKIKDSLQAAEYTIQNREEAAEFWYKKHYQSIALIKEHLDDPFNDAWIIRLREICKEPLPEAPQ